MIYFQIKQGKLLFKDDSLRKYVLFATQAKLEHQRQNDMIAMTKFDKSNSENLSVLRK